MCDNWLFYFKDLPLKKKKLTRMLSYNAFGYCHCGQILCIKVSSQGKGKISRYISYIVIWPKNIEISIKSHIAQPQPRSNKILKCVTFFFCCSGACGSCHTLSSPQGGSRYLLMLESTTTEGIKVSRTQLKEKLQQRSC